MAANNIEEKEKKEKMGGSFSFDNGSVTTCVVEPEIPAHEEQEEEEGGKTKEGAREVLKSQRAEVKGLLHAWAKK